MIEIKRLEKSYGNTKAIRGIDLNFNPGRVTGLLGPNGCGKSTLIKSILGLVKPDKGQILAFGNDISGDIGYRSKIGYMPQNSHFPGHLCSNELISMIEDIRRERAKGLPELISYFDVQAHLKKPTSQLSGGTRQKIAAIMAFMFDPDLLILDEPTVGLDPIAVVRLKNLILKASKSGKTVLLVTHMLSEIEQLVDQMHFMLDGKILFSGSPEEICQRAEEKKLDDAVVKMMSQGYVSEGVL